MKKIATLAIAIFCSVFYSSQMSATHVAGGDMQYRYIGDSTGTPHHYEIYMRIYRDASGAGLGANANVTISSSCFSNQTVSLQLVPGTGTGNIAPTMYDCVVQNTPGATKVYEIFIYRNTVVLPGLCANFRIAYSLCCRPSYDNIAGQPVFYFDALLNNQLGPNNSPFFVSEPVRAFCVGRTFNWAQPSIEVDGDSVHYTFISPRSAATNNIPYLAGWTVQQPIRSNPPLSMHPTTGTITFTPTNQEVALAALVVDEFRFDSLFNVWVHVGYANRDMIVVVANACDPAVAGGVQLDYNQPGMYPDPITGHATVDYDCLTDRVKLFFSVSLDCSSVDQGDFRLTRPDGQPIPIKDLEPNCDVNNEAFEMDVVLFRSLFLNGDYILYSKEGNDGNTLINKCGFAMPEFDTIILRVDDCPILDWDLLNVSVIENTYPEVTWEWDHSGIPPGRFTEFEIQRSPNNGANYFVAGVEPDSTVTVFEDLQITTVNVNERFYRYKLAVKLANEYIDTTRSIRSIFLRHINANMDGTEPVQLRWNSYDGWPDVEYTLMWSKDEGGPLNWQPLDVPQNPTRDTAMDFNMPEAWDAGDYNLRIDASDSNGVIAFISHSNWISFELLEPPVEPTTEIVIPSVFTPNNDGRNDFFIIENIDKWTTRRAVVIYNRWGKKVYEATMYENGNPWDGRDMSSGAVLPDGVYFYIIDIENEPTNESEQHKGTVTISRGN